MDLLPCGHAAYAGSSRMCTHLIGTEDEEHVRLLSGQRLDSDLCCRACDHAAQKGERIELVVACQGCVARIMDADWSIAGWRGTPGIVETSVPVPVIDIAPIAAQLEPVWLLLAEDGRIGRFHAELGTWEVLACSTVPVESDHEPWMGHSLRPRLHASASGRYAAVVNDFSRYGQVLDLDTGAVTLTLDGGGYHADTVPSRWRSSSTAGRRW